MQDAELALTLSPEGTGAGSPRHTPGGGSGLTDADASAVLSLHHPPRGAVGTEAAKYSTRDAALQEPGWGAKAGRTLVRPPRSLSVRKAPMKPTGTRFRAGRHVSPRSPGYSRDSQPPKRLIPPCPHPRA